ncbi:MAG: DEAD/DEAH box helicase [Actinomycetaceae bacterium]|nr:DEAD/DEAH box helicase [Actinomycetaceae bacterium]
MIRDNREDEPSAVESDELANHADISAQSEPGTIHGAIHTPAALTSPPAASLAPALIQLLTSRARGTDQLVHSIHIPRREPTRADWPSWAHPQVITHYQATGVSTPWKHQVHGANSIHERWHTVLATGTGSGKSLSAWLPVLSAIEGDRSTRLSDMRRRPTTLYLAPTKALAADQFHSLHALLHASDQPLRARVGIADGDTSREAKDWARAQADIILTNPDYLHHVLLPGYQRWTRLLSGLRYIIIDEMHYWRGITGAHIALVLRRLLRIARYLGAHPTVIFLSATISQPADSAARLIGVDPAEVVAIVDDTSPAGERELILWQPGYMIADDVPIHDFLRAVEGAGDDDRVLTADMQRRSATSEAASLTAAMVEKGAKVLTFVRSRAAAESVAAQARDTLARCAPTMTSTVSAYRGGYLPEERRALETALRTGATRALATTNALELGVDVSGLDATITAGWPGTRASLWQQTGRAGRAGASGVSVLIASDNPLDSYLIHHHDMILNEVETTVFDPTNPQILAPHLCAAAAELALRSEDLDLFGLSNTAMLQALAEQGYLRKRPSGWYWNAALPMRAQDLTDLRGSRGDVQVVDDATGTVIGTVSADQAHSQVHPGAIYVHQGRTYQVVELTTHPKIAGSAVASVGSGGARVALVRPVITQLRTRPTVVTNVRIVHQIDSWTSPDHTVTWSYGEVEVESQVTDFDTLRLPGLEFVSNTKLDLPTSTLPTVAVWWQVDELAATRLGIPARELTGALHAAEHASIGILPLLATCDRWDLGGLSTADHEQTHRPTVFIHDSYPGGAGFSEFAFRRAFDWVRTTLEVIESCSCENGCPSCIQSPKCGNRNEPLSKDGAVKLLRLLVTHCPSSS